MVDVVLRSRKLLELSGVLKVSRFDPQQFILDTKLGPLRIDGSGLHMKQLSLEQGVAIIEGTISRIWYVSEKDSSGSWLAKMLK